MSDMQQSDLPGQPGTEEGETEHSESEPVAPSVEGRETADQGGGTA
jgi:hypothetical protein